MAMVLSETYSSAERFYASRAVRIYIPYFAILLIICIGSAASGLLWSDWLALKAFASSPLQKNGLCGFLLATMSNITILFQDWTLFLKQDYGETLRFTANFRQSNSMLWQYLVIYPAWSVALELYFYAMAPFLNRLNTDRLLLIIVTATGLRTFCYQFLGLDGDPWNYRFFPFELSTFVIGMLAYRVYRNWQPASPGQLRVHEDPPIKAWQRWYISYPVLLVVLFLYAWILKRAVSFGVIYYLAFFPLVLFLPVLFHHFRISRLDRYIGELSYPVYLLHVAAIPLARKTVSLARLNPQTFGPLAAVMSLCAAAALLKWVITPVERWRQQFKV